MRKILKWKLRTQLLFPTLLSVMSKFYPFVSYFSIVILFSYFGRNIDFNRISMKKDKVQQTIEIFDSDKFQNS